jgi:hypothetical protein
LLDAIEQRRRNGEVAVGRVSVADTPDVAVDAEDLLDDDEAATRRALRIGAIRGDFNMRPMTLPPDDGGIVDARGGGSRLAVNRQKKARREECSGQGGFR